MIKSNGLIKLLKLSCLGLLTSFFTLYIGSSANAGHVQVIGLESSPSFVDTNYNLTFFKGGGLLTNYLGQGKSILAIDNNALFRWTPNGQPYFYDPSFQGFFGQYRSCDELTGLDSVPTNCTASTIDGDYANLFKSFFNKVTVGDYAYYDFVSYHNNYANGYSYGETINVCRSSHEIGKSLCFRYSYCRISQGSSCNNRNYGSLTGSQNYSGLTFSNIPYGSIGYAPGQNGYDGSRDNEENNTNNNSTNIRSCPTIKQIMQNMGENYNTGLCYNNTAYFNGTNFEQTEKEDIFTIFDDNYENYTNRISIYENNCRAPATTENCGKAFSGEFKKFSIISNALNSYVNGKNLRNYCNLGLNYDPNATTCTTNPEGIVKEEYTTEEQIQNIINNGAIATPYKTGDNQDNVLNALNKCEDGDRDCYVNNRNFIDSLKNIYGKITGLFKERNGVNGIIPNYVLRITFLTILFTVIFKK